MPLEGAEAEQILLGRELGAGSFGKVHAGGKGYGMRDIVHHDI